MIITSRLFTAAAVHKAKPADKAYDLPDRHGLTLSFRTSGKNLALSLPAHEFNYFIELA